jgi:hypothetical protein
LEPWSTRKPRRARSWQSLDPADTREIVRSRAETFSFTASDEEACGKVRSEGMAAAFFYAPTDTADFQQSG